MSENAKYDFVHGRSLGSSQYLIYSKEHRGFWRKPAYGYTQSINEAGRYSYDEAKQILKNANQFLPEDGSWEEVMVLAPEEIL